MAGGTEANQNLLENLLEWRSIITLSARIVRAAESGMLPVELEADAYALALAILRYQEAFLGVTRHNPY